MFRHWLWVAPCLGRGKGNKKGRLNGTAFLWNPIVPLIFERSVDQYEHHVAVFVRPV